MAVGDRRSSRALAPRVAPSEAETAPEAAEAPGSQPTPPPEPVVVRFPRAIRLLILILAAAASWGLVALLARLLLGGR